MKFRNNIMPAGLFWLVCQSLCFSGCAQPAAQSSAPAAASRELAFPGAEGFGKYTTGGRGGKVYVVTNLNDKGAGSFREGVSGKSSPRIVVFAVAGTIHLESPVSIKSNVTIAGQSAPGGGICLAD